MTFWNDYEPDDRPPEEKPEPNRWAELFLSLALAGMAILVVAIFWQVSGR